MGLPLTSAVSTNRAPPALGWTITWRKMTAIREAKAVKVPVSIAMKRRSVLSNVLFLIAFCINVLEGMLLVSVFDALNPLGVVPPWQITFVVVLIVGGGCWKINSEIRHGVMRLVERYVTARISEASRVTEQKEELQ